MKMIWFGLKCKLQYNFFCVAIKQIMFFRGNRCLCGFFFLSFFLQLFLAKQSHFHQLLAISLQFALHLFSPLQAFDQFFASIGDKPSTDCSCRVKTLPIHNFPAQFHFHLGFSPIDVTKTHNPLYEYHGQHLHIPQFSLTGRYLYVYQKEIFFGQNWV